MLTVVRGGSVARSFVTMPPPGCASQISGALRRRKCIMLRAPLSSTPDRRRRADGRSGNRRQTSDKRKTRAANERSNGFAHRAQQGQTVSGALSFRSRIDAWVLVVLLSIVAAGLLGLSHVYALFAKGLAAYRWPTIAVLIVLCTLGTVVPLWLLLTTRYSMTDEMLDVRSGPFHRRIAIRDIVDVSRARRARLGPALSSDRLRIEYGAGRSVVVSPENRAAFLRSLEARRRQVGESAAG